MTERTPPSSQPLHDHGSPTAMKEKSDVALSSLLAAVVLTSIKLVVGFSTGSLGILSEAAHSGLDLVAAAITFWAVRVSSRPADREHPYGHGKFENLSALLETALLLITCVWIFYESIERLFFRPATVQPSIWGFIVMGTSIVIDVSRSRALAKAAKKYGSQALEADALHFSTDVWSSCVVLVGLGCVSAAQMFKVPWLEKADALAAMGVAGIVVWVSLKLGKKTIDDLLDAVPPEMRDQAERAAQVPGVLEVRQVRIRRSGPEYFADIVLTVGREVGLERAHDIATAAESSVRSVLQGADVVVHIEPVADGDEGIITTVRLVAARHALGAHDIRVYQNGETRSVELHLEVPDAVALEKAHGLVSLVEADVREAIPSLSRVVTHIEPVGDTSGIQESSSDDTLPVRKALAELETELNNRFVPHDLDVQRVDGEVCVSFHCKLDGSLSITEAHAFTELIERKLRDRVGSLGRIVIHAEPLSKDAGVPSEK